ncbi:retrovirus-related pol polyprotein from transposon TNT 1-94 [Tanacetum coccineum]
MKEGSLIGSLSLVCSWTNEGGWMSSVLDSSASFVTSLSFSTTGGRIGGPSYETPLRVVIAMASFLGFGMQLKQQDEHSDQLVHMKKFRDNTPHDNSDKLYFQAEKDAIFMIPDMEQSVKVSTNEVMFISSQLQPEWSRLVPVCQAEKAIALVFISQAVRRLKQFQNNESTKSQRSNAPITSNLLPHEQVVYRTKAKRSQPSYPIESFSAEDSDQTKLGGIRICKRRLGTSLLNTDEEIDEQELEDITVTCTDSGLVSPVESSSTDYAIGTDLGVVNYLERKLDELESEKADFSNIYEYTSRRVSNSTTSVSGRPLLKVLSVKRLDLIQGNVTIKRVYYVEGLNHNLFSVGQFCDADLEVAFRKSTCFVRDLQGNDLLTGNRGSDLYTISLQETTSSTPICFMAKASPTQAWLWHRRLSHLNFDYITLLSKKDIVTGLPKLTYVKDQLCSSCEMSKAKRSSFKSKAVPSSKGRLNLLHMDLCGPMRVASINGKKYILVIVDDYSRYTWTLFLRSKDETPEVLKDFLTMIQRNLQAQVITVRTDRGTEFLNKTLHAYFKEEGIEHQTSTPRTPEQNGAEAVATACYTQNRSIIISTHGKTAYHIINDRKPSIKHLHIFGCICYITRDGENLDKIKEKGDPCVMVGYSTQSKGYRVYNKRTRLIVESIHIKFDEIKEMMSDHNSSDLAPQRQEMLSLQASFLKDKRRQIMTTLTPCPQDKMLFLQQKSQIRHIKGNIKDTAMDDSAWIGSNAGELHQFDRLISLGYTSRTKQSGKDDYKAKVEEVYDAFSRRVIVQIISEKVYPSEKALYDSKNKLQEPEYSLNYQTFLMSKALLKALIMPDALILGKGTYGGNTFLGLCSSIVDEDTASRLWLSNTSTNTLNEYQLADMFTKALLRIGLRSCLKDWYESLTLADLEVLEMRLHKVVRLGINPMIQPEPEDLPKDNPKLEIAVLRPFPILHMKFGKLVVMVGSNGGKSLKLMLASKASSPSSSESTSMVSGQIVRIPLPKSTLA